VCVYVCVCAHVRVCTSEVRKVLQRSKHTAEQHNDLPCPGPSLHMHSRRTPRQWRRHQTARTAGRVGAAGCGCAATAAVVAAMGNGLAGQTLRVPKGTIVRFLQCVFAAIWFRHLHMPHTPRVRLTSVMSVTYSPSRV